MSDFKSDPAQPILLKGSAFERGLAHARLAGVTGEEIRDAVIARVEQAHNEGVIDIDALAYIDAQRDFLQTHDSDTMGELRGIAEGFSIPMSVVFIHQHLTVLRDLKKTAKLDADGCSTWAVDHSEDGPLVVKNRDFSGTHLGIQRVFLHQGPDIETGAMLCVSSAGSPGAYSSGINAAGLAVADTHVGSRLHGVGWLRYFLMTRILATCRTVEEALAFIRARKHAGGGNLVLADRGGHTLAVEIGTDDTGVEIGASVWRTNHFVTTAMAPFNLHDELDQIDSTSMERFAYLSREVPRGAWSIEGAARLMASHAADRPDSAPLCQHADRNGSQTISSAVFSCWSNRLDFLEGNPCSGRWHRYEIAL